MHILRSAALSVLLKEIICLAMFASVQQTSIVPDACCIWQEAVVLTQVLLLAGPD